MDELIAQYFDSGTTFLAALIMFTFYFSRKIPVLYKKAWVLVVSCGFFIYSLGGIVITLQKDAAGRLLTKKEILNEIETKKILVQKDYAFNSHDGYTIIIPAGYSYTLISKGELKMVAVKEKFRSSLLIAKIKGNEELEEMIKATCEVLLKRNPTYVFAAQSYYAIGNHRAVKVNFQVTKQDAIIKGISVFAKSGNTFFQLTLSCQSDFYEQSIVDFDKIVHSFKLL